MEYDQEFLDALDVVAGWKDPPPAMFSPAWWNGPYAQAFLHQSPENRKRFAWLVEHGAGR